MNKSLKIKIDFGVNSLYDLGYLSLDLYQLAVFCELIEDEGVERALEIFSNTSFNRYHRIIYDYREKVQVTDVRNGCIEILISEIGVLASIIMPFVGAYVSNYITESKQTIKFEIEASDTELNKLLDELKNGYYGKKEEDWFEWLIKTLNNEGYSTEIISSNCYKVIKSYGKRIVKTIPKKIR